jgi:protein-tyrosine-phosphatase
VRAQRRPLAAGEGVITQHAGDAAVALVGGSEPGEQVNRAPIAALAERGIDISGEYPKPWTDGSCARPTW